MVERPVTSKQPIMWECRYWLYRETGIEGSNPRSRGGLFVSKFYRVTHKFMGNKNIISNVLIVIGAAISVLTKANIGQVIGGWMAIGLLSWGLSALIRRMFKMTTENKKLTFSIIVILLASFSLFGTIVGKQNGV